MIDVEKVLIVDFGGQYSKLIARRIRELNIYSEVLPFTTDIKKIKDGGYKAIIFSGGPASVYEKNSPTIKKEIFNLGVPLLGICYGAHLIANILGGKVQKGKIKEYGDTELEVDKSSKVFKAVSKKNTVWMSHTDFISKLPKGFTITSKTKDCPVASMEDIDKKIYAVQFHPEVTNSTEGTAMLKNFLVDIAGCKQNWVIASFLKNSIADIKKMVGNKKALCALSGGVDSSVAALMVSKAIGKNLTCVFVDHGLLRKNEAEEVEKVFSKKFGIKLIKVDAKKRFLDKLKNVTDPEKKRKIIGKEFIAVFEDVAKKIGEVDYLIQGTIYPDVIESGFGASAMIKSHHNVGGLPKKLKFKHLLEPLRELFKDEVRKVGLELGLPEDIVFRQPFPGPGLGVRIMGKITEEKIAILQDADYIFRDEIKKAGLDRSINQYFAALTDMRSVGVMGDARTYFYTVGLRAVVTSDFMTARWAEIPHSVLAKVSTRIVNEVHGVSRVVYDITNKPPATIEWL